MNIKRSHWFVFIFLALISFALWWQISYPQMAILNFSLNRTKAVNISRNFLKELSVPNIDEFKTASIFDFDRDTNRYIKKAVNFGALKHFIQQHDYDLFFWIVRFYKEKTKEEYRVVVSSASGEVIAYKHIIEETAHRRLIEREEALTQAVDFLSQRFKFIPTNYTLKDDTKNVHDHRTDYSFSWDHNEVNIPWSQKKDSGTGKLSKTVTITGDEILSFSKNTFSVPEEFNRDIARIKNTGQNLTTFIRIIYFTIFTIAIYTIISRRNHLAMHTTKLFYMGVVAAAFVFNLGADWNEFQIVLANYNTTVPFNDYLWRYWIENIRQTFLVSLMIIVPALAGELLRYEVFPQKKQSSFAFYIHSTFLSKDVVRLILLGYLIFPILLGMQTLLYSIGEKYLGVWKEFSWANNMSTAYWPFLSAFIIGFNASLFEELFFRMFGLSWGKKVFRNTVVTVLFMSFFWGFAHSGHPVYPMWFRGVEVGCIGLFMSFIYLKFGIIPTLVGHFLFNVFWNSAGFLFGETQLMYLLSILSVLALPLLWAMIAFCMNKQVVEKPMTWKLNKAQQYNLHILESYLRLHPEYLNQRTHQQLSKEISSNGWDIAVVDKAITNVFGPNPSTKL